MFLYSFIVLIVIIWAISLTYVEGSEITILVSYTHFNKLDMNQTVFLEKKKWFHEIGLSLLNVIGKLLKKISHTALTIFNLIINI